MTYAKEKALEDISYYEAKLARSEKFSGNARKDNVARTCQMLYRNNVHQWFTARDIKWRIKASKAETFEELRQAVLGSAQ